MMTDIELDQMKKRRSEIMGRAEIEQKMNAPENMTVNRIRMNDVPLVCQDLIESVADLYEAIEQLQEKLKSVTNYEPTEEAEKVTLNTPSFCELSGTIRSQVTKLNGITQRIRNHISALEL